MNEILIAQVAVEDAFLEPIRKHLDATDLAVLAYRDFIAMFPDGNPTVLYSRVSPA